MKNKQFIGMAILILTAIIWGNGFVFQKVAADLLDAYTFCGVRMTIAAVAVSIFTLILSKKNGGLFSDTEYDAETYRKNTIVGGFQCGFCISVALIVQQIGMLYTTAGKAGFITALYIIFVPVAGAIFMHKKNTLIRWLAVFIGVAGLFILCVDDELIFSKGDLIIFCSSFAYCAHLLCCDYYSKRGNPLKISAIQLMVSAAISWIAAFLLGSPSIESIKAAIIPIFYCGIVSSGFGYTFQIIGQRYIDPVKATITLSMESVFAVLFGALLLNEHMTLRQIIGCCMMFFAIIIVQLPERRKTR